MRQIQYEKQEFLRSAEKEEYERSYLSPQYVITEASARRTMCAGRVAKRQCLTGQSGLCECAVDRVERVAYRDFVDEKFVQDDRQMSTDDNYNPPLRSNVDHLSITIQPNVKTDPHNRVESHA